MQIAVAAFSVDDILLDVPRRRCRGRRRLRRIERQVRQRDTGGDGSQKRSSRHVMT